MDDIVSQGVALGTYWYLFTGGEPLVRKKDLIRLCEAHPDCPVGKNIHRVLDDKLLRIQAAMEQELKSITLADMDSDLGKCLGK